MMAQTLSVLLFAVSTTTLPILAKTLPLTAVTNERHGSQVFGVYRETVSTFYQSCFLHKLLFAARPANQLADIYVFQD